MNSIHCMANNMATQVSPAAQERGKDPWVDEKGGDGGTVRDYGYQLPLYSSDHLKKVATFTELLEMLDTTRRVFSMI
jgi:hypothetical protein